MVLVVLLAVDVVAAGSSGDLFACTRTDTHLMRFYVLVIAMAFIDGMLPNGKIRRHLNCKLLRE